MQKNINIFSKTAMSLLLIVVFTNVLYAQKNTTSFLKDYFLLGTFTQYTNNFNYDLYLEDPTVNLEYLPYNSLQFGVVVNVYQTKKFNFKTGFIFKPRFNKKRIIFTSQQTNLPYDATIITIGSSGLKLKEIPLIAEYIVPISNKIKWYIAPGFSINWMKDYGGGEGNILNGAGVFVTYDDLSDNIFFFDFNLGTGFYFLLKPFLLQIGFRYSKSLTPVEKGDILIDNFQTVPHSSTGTMKESGDYYGIYLSIFIKRRSEHK